MTKPKKWRIVDEDKQIDVWCRLNGREFRVSVENDDVSDTEEKQVRKLAEDIARLPRLLEIEKLVKGMFDDGVLDPYPSSDGCAEYLLCELTAWKRKETRK